MRLLISSSRLLLLASLLLSASNAQLTNAPELSTATIGASTAAGTGKTSEGSSAKQTDQSSASGQSSNSGGSQTSAPAAAATTEGTGGGIVGAPGLSSSSGGAYDGITNAPTVTNPGQVAAPTYPPPSIPPTADAPFMQKSALPQGTVFITAAAVLGFAIGLIILWRCMVVWSVRRSMKRAARGYALMGPMANNRSVSESKGMLLAPYPGKTRDSSLSLDPMPPSSRHQQMSKGSSLNPSQRESLFFSPTAGAGITATTPIPASGTPGGNRDSVNMNRSSTYLPAGYYQTGSAAAGGRPMSSVNLIDNSSSNPQRPISGYRAYSDSPQLTPQNELPPPVPHSYLDSPRLNSPASMGGGAGVGAGGPTTANVRAPSAYLEDLFDSSTVQPQEGPRF